VYIGDNDHAYLRMFLAPLLPIFAEQPALEHLARQIAAFSSQGVSRTHPLLSAALPDGTRVQIVLPPASRQHIIMAFRTHGAAHLRLEQLCGGDTAMPGIAQLDRTASLRQIEALLETGHRVEALRAAVQSRCTILVSGGTSSGKTTFLNAMLAEIAEHERLVVIEDTPELTLTRPNAIGLLAVRGALGEAAVSANDLVSASLRLRPDRIILGELRGDEAYAYLRAINTGHPGSMSTIHADSAEGAIEQLVLLVLHARTGLSRSDIAEYIRQTVDVFVHLGRQGGARGIAQIMTRNMMWKTVKAEA
jgi:type IV secretion system protein VirB11